MIFVGRSELLLALGWVTLALALLSWLSAAQVGLCLLTLAVSEAVSALVMPQGDQRLLPQTGNADREVERIITVWLFLLATFGGALYFSVVPIYEQDELAALCLAALCLLTPLLILCQRLGSRPSALIPSRLLLLSALALGLKAIGVENDETFLPAAVMLFFLLAMTTFRPLLHAIGRDMPINPSFDAHLALACIMRRMDLFVLPILMSPPTALSYLLARGLASGLTTTLDHLINRAFYSMATNAPRADLPVAEAARVNLGVLFVGGGVAVALMSGLPMISSQLDGLASDVSGAAGWLILGALGPAIFGAAPAFLVLSSQKRELTLIVLLVITCFIALVATTPEFTPVAIAQRAAIAQLAFGALAAALLALKTGVWPGLTAVLFRQIKLF